MEFPKERDDEALIRAADFTFQRTYGRTTFVALLLWVGVSLWAFLSMGLGVSAFLITVGGALLVLFGMRTFVHLKATPLREKVEQYCSAHEITLDALIEVAKESSSFPFFLSLVDGPLARQARERAQSSAS